ncbi:MAG TPA: AMP-binding protein, partial [Acidimicrobiia bacterium]
MTEQAVLTERAEIDAVVEGKTIVDYFNRNAERHGDRPAMHWKGENGFEDLTWSQYRDVAHQVAAGLSTLGVTKDEFVAIQAGNRPEHVIADMGAVHAGATPVTVYSTLAAEEIQYIAENCGATVAILEGLDFMKRWEQIRSELPNLRYVVLMSGAENYDTADWVLSWDELLARGTQQLQDDPETVARSVAQLTPDTLATLIYTSGTTGTPKGVMISHYNALWTVECVRRGAELKLGARLVSYLPLAHIAERMVSHYVGIYLAGEVWFCPNLAGVLEYILEARPTLFVAVPRVYEKFHARLVARFAEASGIKGAILKMALNANTKRVAAEENGGSGSAIAGILD